ncbi:MAG: ABC transporter ATP-binding protein [Arthrobacter sp.]|uniref:ABC transporter ATP-binding protein n=1 Tax=unclassified Arthrobacter TaxID=235627 RepID=UPI00264D7D7B|nr:ABC transporter ATP-binding protein/permease [Micrococcaceae bacterium]MDN5823936.1 ABC transporter ATP-binding protein/permease [Micrococcaceae bacterium]MDN5878938.1 ABC transporter ATP-binding protein/permease [Micrococcaceae bacterium]MDN5886357.1 ABC transporter ATP-binding protein/permease [Micrococcaceae bacterium]MDN6169555.1 ABC transporter ATP-binding protein/permease [Micrococcaceae bacterium]
MAEKKPAAQVEDLEDFAVSADDGFGDQRPVRKAKAFWPATKRLMGLMAPEKAGIAVVLLFVAVGVVLTVIAPKILGRAMDVIFSGVIGSQMAPGTSKAEAVSGLRAQGKTNLADMLERMDLVPGTGIDFHQLGVIISFVLMMYFVANVFMWAQGYLLNKLVMRVVYRLRKDVEDKLNKLPLNYFDTRQRGDLLSRVTNDVDNIQTALQQAFSQLLESILTVVGIVIMMFIVSWQLALIALVALPLSAVAAALIGTRAQGLFAEQWKSTGTLNGQIEESFSGHDLMKVFGREEESVARFDERNEELFKASFGAQFVSGTIFPVMQFISYLAYVGIAVVGGLRVASGQMSLGDATAFIQYSREFTQPLGQIAGMANQVQSGVASAERTFELLDAQEQEAETPTARLAARTEGHVQFTDVTFSYDPARPLIEDLSFEAHPGHTVAIVGPTGAGKTTLVNLVMRFYELDGGAITLDGIDITALSRAELRSKVGMVLQDAWLFNGTIIENIRYGRLDATDEEVHEAATATYVDRFVKALPEGYDTIIDDEGTNVSAGEKQLITIARAFLANPSLLILDEATSSVDTRTEVLVQHAMAALRTDRTSFVIAHRLSTIRDADTILVMEAGRIVEQGSHEVLLAARGAYYRLYMSQFAGPAEDPDIDPDAGDGAGAVPVSDL